MTRKEALQEFLEKVDAGENLSGNTQFWADLDTAFPRNARAVGDFAKAFYGSLDAAKALHEAVLPGWDWQSGRDVCCIYPAGDKDRYGIWGHDIEGKNPARAWLIAIIKALISETEQ